MKDTYSPVIIAYSWNNVDAFCEDDTLKKVRKN